VRDKAFIDFTVHTRWIETEWVNEVLPFTNVSDVEEEEPRRKVVVEVGGKRLEVSLPASFGGATAGPAVAKPTKRAAKKGHGVTASGDALAAPMQGTIVKLTVAEGDSVAEGDTIVVLEAMKMEQPLIAHKSGVVTGLKAAVGDVVQSGTVLCEIR
jgi:acetyl-CoA/propionyl-CoA carboxylase biotin carboxyl carrier protein